MVALATSDRPQKNKTLSCGFVSNFVLSENSNAVSRQRGSVRVVYTRLWTRRNAHLSLMIFKLSSTQHYQKCDVQNTPGERASLNSEHTMIGAGWLETKKHIRAARCHQCASTEEGRSREEAWWQGHAQRDGDIPKRTNPCMTKRHGRACLQASA